MQNKNLKLKLGLCGLALTSFLVVNAQNVVHADTVQNNNAITWDSDSDDSQVVKEAPEHQTAPQAVQKQSTVQASQSQPVQNKKVMISDVSSTSVSQKRAETSNLCQSNAQTSTVNRLNADNHQAKVANVNATVKDAPVQITNPQNNQVIVHYVKFNGQSAGLADQTIDVTKGDGKYNAPSGYTLAKGDGSYKVSSTDNGATASVTMRAFDGSEYQSVLVNDSAVTNDILGIIKDDIRTNYSSLPFQDGSDPMSHVKSYSVVGSILGKNDSGLTIDFSGGDGTADGQGVGLTYIYSYYDSHSGQEAQGSRNVAIPTGVAQDLQDYYNKYTLNILNSNGTGLWFGGDSNSSDRLIMGDVSMNHSYTFNDGGSATSSTGDYINVPVTQPVSVNDASQTRKTAERIISVNLPNDQGARDRYKGMLNANNQIVQMITFTRTMTKDNLTGAVLSQSAWQGPSSFPSVTLPDIPGYTMTMN